MGELSGLSCHRVVDVKIPEMAIALGAALAFWALAKGYEKTTNSNEVKTEVQAREAIEAGTIQTFPNQAGAGYPAWYSGIPAYDYVWGVLHSGGVPSPAAVAQLSVNQIKELQYEQSNGWQGVGGFYVS